MSQTNKMILVGIVATLISGGGVYLWQLNGLPESPPVSTQEQDQNEREIVVSPTEGAAKYNCELSGGSFNDGICECPIEKELGQTQDMMYDKNKGFCQTTFGGPGGDAFAASVGLPWGNFSFWTKIVGNNCTETGGGWLNARCKCGDGLTYDQSTGYCK